MSGRDLVARLCDAANYPRFRLLILVFALLLRVLWVAAVPVAPESDSAAYERFALNIFQNGTFGWTPGEPFAFWPPGTSAFYALLFALFGPNYWAIELANLLLSMGIVLLAMSTARLFFHERAALLCGALMAVWPTLIMYNTILASELPFLISTLAGLRVWAGSGSLWVRGVGAGLLLGIACYVRPLALMLPLVYAASFFFRRADKANFLEQGRILMVSLAVMLAAIAPWTYRNYLLYDEVILVSTNGGITFWMGNSPGTSGDFADPPPWADALPDNERARALKAIAIDYIVADPAAFVSRTAKKAVMLHAKETVGVYWNRIGITKAFGEGWIGPLKLLSTSFWLSMLLLAIAAAAILLRRDGFIRGLSHPLILPWLYFTAVHAITVATDRYHMSFAAYVAILAGFALSSILSRWDKGRPSGAQ